MNMNPWLMGAVALSVLIAVTHSVLGEQRILGVAFCANRRCRCRGSSR